MPTGFTNSDKDFRKLSADELLAAEEALRKNRKAEQLRRLTREAPSEKGGVFFRGTVGSGVTKMVHDYRNRVLAAGGVAEALDCLHATLQRYWSNTPID